MNGERKIMGSVGTEREREREREREKGEGLWWKEINGIVVGDSALGIPSFSVARDKSRGQGSNARPP